MTMSGFVGCAQLGLVTVVGGWLAMAAAGAAEVGADVDPVVSAVQKVLPAVVNISTEQLVERAYRDPFDDFWRQFFGQPPRPRYQGRGQSLGSGAIIDEDGWIVTNFHVVRRASRIQVQLSQGDQFDAQYVSGDEKNDLALLKINAPQPLPAIRLATAREPLLGETLIAVGNPFGLEHTVTKGVLSAKNRTYVTGDVTFDDILQTDAAINPGNSGGPLINVRGELVGINMAVLSQAEGIGFAIPARRVARLLARWFTPEKRSRLWLGLRFDWVDQEIVVVDVQPDSPAAKAGVAREDQVRGVDELSAVGLLELQRHLIHKQMGDRVRLRLERRGEPLEITIQLAALPEVSPSELLLNKFGVHVQPLTEDLARAIGINVARGLLVADVEGGSPAENAQFRRGMVITHIAGEELHSPDRLVELLGDIRRGDEVPLAVVVAERRGNLLLQRTASVTLTAR